MDRERRYVLGFSRIHAKFDLTDLVAERAMDARHSRTSSSVQDDPDVEDEASSVIRWVAKSSDAAADHSCLC